MFIETLIAELNDLISHTKDLHCENLAKKLNNPLLQAKTYWSILKSFYNDTKVPLTPPLLIDDKFVTDIQTKTNILNKFFADHCQPLNNASDLPTNQIFLTQSRLGSLDFNEGELLQTIRVLNINKAHGHDDKKNDKQLVENYRPISLLPIFGKIFEKIIFSRIYNFLLEEDLLNPNQSGFRPSDTCINQLLAITHEIFEAFDCNPFLEVRSVYSDISKAFDKVWHKGLLYKLKSMGISGDLFNLLENYLSGRLQRVVLNGQTSSWRPFLAGVPQGSILGPHLFLVYINDLPNELKSNVKLFADDTSLFTIIKDKQESADVLNNDLSLMPKWAFNWKMLINPDTNKPAQELLFSRKKKTQNHPNVSLNSIQVERVSHQKHLDIILDEKLNFKEQIDSTMLKVKRGIAVLKKLRYNFQLKSLITIYKDWQSQVL